MFGGTIILKDSERIAQFHKRSKQSKDLEHITPNMYGGTIILKNSKCTAHFHIKAWGASHHNCLVEQLF